MQLPVEHLQRLNYICRTVDGQEITIRGVKERERESRH